MIEKVISVALMGILAQSAIANSPAVVQLSMDDDLGTTPQKFDFPGGTHLTNARFYQSGPSGVSIGRVTLDGPALPVETINYTDVFLVVRGTAKNLQPDGTRQPLQTGDIVILPRGLTLHGSDFKNYVHFYASFERQPDAVSNGPLVERRLDPKSLKATDFAKDEDGLLRHTYYEGRGSVLIQGVRYPMRKSHEAVPQASESDLLFVVKGSGTIEQTGAPTIALRPNATVFIPRNASYSLSERGLQTVTIRFDRT